MSLLHFDTQTAKNLVRQLEQSSAAITPASFTTRNSDTFITALAGAINRSNQQASHLADYLTRVCENSSRVIAHAQTHDAELGRRLEALK